MMEFYIKHKIFGSDGYKWLEVSEEVKQGSLVHIAGSSGIGKTTLLHAIAGLIKPDFGFIRTTDQIFLDTAKDICLPPQKRNVALMFQQYALFPNMTIQENILFAQKSKNQTEIDEFLEVFGLEKLRNRFPAELSGGQQQRTALARALAQKAQILLLDEPFSAVEEDMRKIMMDEILKFQHKHFATVFIVSHNSEELKATNTEIIHII